MLLFMDLYFGHFWGQKVVKSGKDQLSKGKMKGKCDIMIEGEKGEGRNLG